MVSDLRSRVDVASSSTSTRCHEQIGSPWSATGTSSRSAHTLLVALGGNYADTYETWIAQSYAD